LLLHKNGKVEANFAYIYLYEVELLKLAG
jgi:hypothetical protein